MYTDGGKYVTLQPHFTRTRTPWSTSVDIIDRQSLRSYRNVQKGQAKWDAPGKEKSKPSKWFLIHDRFIPSGLFLKIIQRNHGILRKRDRKRIKNIFL